MEDREAWTQLTTRIPSDLHRRLKLHCLTKGIKLMDFIVDAIEHRLGRVRAASNAARPGGGVNRSGSPR